MSLYNIYTGLGDLSDEAVRDTTTHLIGYALGLGLPGITVLPGVGGWWNYEGETVIEPIRVFQVWYSVTGNNLPWSLQALAEEIRRVFNQQVVSVVGVAACDWSFTEGQAN